MIESLKTYHFALISLPKIQTDLLWHLTYLFIGLGITYLIFVFFFRNRLSKRAAQVAETKRELAPMISQFLFHDPESSFEERKLYLSQKVEIRELIKHKFNRSILAEILLDLQKDVSGEARQNLYDLYQSLGLHQDAYVKLKSWRWEVISQGILELTQMRVEDSYMFIKRFINHPRGVIRKQAQIATVTLKHEGISYFLDTARYRISEWQQLKLLDVLRNLEDFDPPRFKIWLTSKNNDVVLFSLRLIRYYNQNDANHALIQLIKHRNSHIKAEAIQCLKEFGVIESIETLKKAFRRCNADIRILILDAIGALGNESDIPFLQKVERSDTNFTVKSKAISAINTIDPESIMPSSDIQEPSKSDIQFAEEPLDEVNEEFIPTINTTDMKNEQSEEEVTPVAPELEDENEEIFNLCCIEELQDILDDVHQEDEPEYLPLNFLPIVEGEANAIPEENAEQIQESEINSEEISAEEKFRHDLNAILNMIAMSDNQNKPKTNDEIPEFLPLVVEDNQVEEDHEPLNQATQLSLDFSVTSEISDEDSEVISSEITNGNKPEAGVGMDILDTPVVAETISWEDMLGISPRPDQNPDNSSDDEDDIAEELLGFSIFHEMFRDFDAESKLILLDEILVVGEEKELRFLGTLSNDPDKRVRNKALKIKNKLAEKLNANEPSESIEDHDPESTVVSGERETIEEIQQEESKIKPKEKMPLEYCFYNPGEEDLTDLSGQELHFDLNLPADIEIDSEDVGNREDETSVEENRE